MRPDGDAVVGGAAPLPDVDVLDVELELLVVGGRSSATEAGDCLKCASCSPVNGVSSLGRTRFALRWKRCTRRATLAASGSS